MLGPQQSDVAANIGIGGMTGEKVVHAPAGVWKQHLMDELDGRRGALDVQKDDADVREYRFGSQNFSG